MGFSVRLKGQDSWLDPESAGLLGWKLGKRLAARIAGCEGRFITLTYDRSRFADAQDCFDRARAQKHVSRFMRKLGQLLGVNLRGKWLCKMEFQEDGWVHWHIVLVDVGKIPHHKFCKLYDLWGRGSINVKPLTEENAKYLMKYVAKDGNIPGWIYGYPSRSVKVVRPSQGFWNDEQARKAAERTASRKADGDKSKRDNLEWYVPVGEKIRQQRAVIRDGKRTFSVRALPEFLSRAIRKYVRTEGVTEGQWRHFPEEPSSTAEAVARDCEAASTAAAPSAGAEPSHNRGEGPLFLRGIGKRVGWWAVRWRGRWRYLRPGAVTGRLSKWWAENAPWWVKLEWEQDGRSRLPEVLEAAWYRSDEYRAWAGGCA